MELHQALIAAGTVLFAFEYYHVLPFWADLVFTIGFMFLLNGLAGAIDYFNNLGKIQNKEED